MHAYEHLLMLNSDYGNFGGEEVELNLELNNSIAEMQFNSQFDIAIKNSLKILRKYKNSVYKIPVVNHYILLGRCYTNTGKFEKAEQSLLYAACLIAPEDP